MTYRRLSGDSMVAKPETVPWVGRPPILALCLDPGRCLRYVLAGWRSCSRRHRDGFPQAAHESNGYLASERSAAWLAHQSGGLGVAGSNPAAPTNKIKDLENIFSLASQCRVSLVSQNDAQNCKCWKAGPLPIAQSRREGSQNPLDKHEARPLDLVR